MSPAGCSGNSVAPTTTAVAAETAAQTTEAQTTEEAGAAAEVMYQPGTYTGTGNNGPVTLEVVVSADAIESVTVTEHGETPGISDPAIEKHPAYCRKV